jgi:hypothetical protein
MMPGVLTVRGLPRIVRHRGYQAAGCLDRHNVAYVIQDEQRRKNSKVELVYFYPNVRDMLDAYRSARSFIRRYEGVVSAIRHKGKFLVVALLDDSLGPEDSDYLVTILKSSDGNPYDLREPSILRDMRDFKRQVALKEQRWAEEEYSPGLWIAL